MTVTLTFELPDDRQAMLNAVHSFEMAMTVRDVDQKLLNWIKHGCPKGRTTEELLQELRRDLADAVRIASGNI